jgi:hypothetical protein
VVALRDTTDIRIWVAPCVSANTSGWPACHTSCMDLHIWTGQRQGERNKTHPPLGFWLALCFHSSKNFAKGKWQENARQNAQVPPKWFSFCPEATFIGPKLPVCSVCTLNHRHISSNSSSILQTPSAQCVDHANHELCFFRPPVFCVSPSKLRL